MRQDAAWRISRVVAVLALAFVPHLAAANTIGEGQSLFYKTSVAPSRCQFGADQFDSGTTNWRNAIASHTTVGPHDNTIFWSEIGDPAFTGEDNINNNLETSDIGFLATHGDALTNCSQGDPNCTWYRFDGRLTTHEGNPDSKCWFKSSYMWLGNSDTEYFDLFACDALEMMVSPDYESDVAYGLHQWHGYEGTMAVGTGTATELDDYVHAAFNSSASNSWVIWQTSYRHWSSTSPDVCGTSKTWGDSQSDANSRATNEKYGTGTYQDPGWTYWSYMFMGDCDPISEKPGLMGTW